MSKRREKNKPQNTLNRQLEQPEVKEKEKNESLIELGKLSYSMVGMTYAGVILTVLLNFNETDRTPLVWGAIAIVIFTVLGWVLIKRGNNYK